MIAIPVIMCLEQDKLKFLRCYGQKQEGKGGTVTQGSEAGQTGMLSDCHL